MAFEMPETLEGLTLEQVSELHDAARAEAVELNKIPDSKISAEQSAELIELVGFVQELGAHKEQMEADAAAQAESLAAARAALTEPEPEPEPEAEIEIEEPEAEVEVEEKELVTASAAAKRPASFAAKAAAKAPVEPEPEPEPAKGLSLIAAANISDFTSGQELQGLDELARAFVNRGKMFASGGSGSKAGRRTIARPGIHKLSANAQRFSVAKLVKPENEFTITEKMSAEEQYDLIKQAAAEKRLGGGSLVAAGGWCAPAEQIWGFLELEAADGLLDIPEMTARRGSISFTKGPDLATLLAETDLGWVMTEAEVIAGEDTKPCYEIECPDWDEVTLDAVGYCIRAGLLTNSAYPELIRRYLQLGLIVHARRLNALTISRISTAIGAATTFASVGTGNYSSTSDLLSAIELNALRVRETYSMPMNSTVEGVFPLWIKGIVRADLSRRTGVELLSVSDQQIEAWFAQRQISAQFVRDYQAINASAVGTAGGTAGWTRWPNRAEFMLYPAGSFVRLGTDVIDLDTVYDTDGLQSNTYTAAFFEEGFAIANTGGSGVKVLVNLDNVNGASGYPAIGAGEGVSIPVVETP